MTGLARRIQWLFPPTREVYETWRTFFLSGSGGGAVCVRCGGHVGSGEVGFSHRIRGTKWTGKESGHIHRRCVPTADFVSKGIAARKVARRDRS